ncbi:MAG: nodulation protein NfeD [Pseudomonadales bacterium]|jgi:membrane-bound serine protease (ClpP class)|nr:nodulation protein NfeD [Pseudomonadales bacterium]
MDRRSTRRRTGALAAVLLALLALAAPLQAAEVHLIDLEGAIGPASSDHVTRHLAAAEAAGADLFVIRMDTPGGLDAAMRDIIKAILDSEVPVATWVGPNGSRAASAGTYILYASHIAAMAPATNLGAATPVSIGGSSPLPMPGSEPARQPAPEAPDDDDARAEDDDRVPPPATAMERKVINDAVAYIRSLAELRGRNADWAEAAVRRAESLSASEAVERGVVDLIARDVDELLDALDGREIELATGTVVLATSERTVTRMEPDWRSRFLALITDPNIAYILLMVGIYGLILEFYNPGLGIPGITGVICLLIGAYALQMLPISFAGLGLIVVGIGLMIAEAFSPSFGVFGIGGAVAFVVGSVLLLDTDLPAYQLSIPIIAAFAAASALISIGTVYLALRARDSRAVSGREAIIGGAAVALEDFDGTGKVRLAGEHWQARSTGPVTAGQTLRVRALDGLVVEVEPAPARADTND